ncbi:MAG: hypothetical protein ABIE43_04735 [Patescibacteria group bacterium]
MKSKRLLILIFILIAAIALTGVLWYVMKPGGERLEPGLGDNGGAKTERELKLGEMGKYEYDEENLETFNHKILNYTFKYPSNIKFTQQCMLVQEPEKCEIVWAIDSRLNTNERIKFRPEIIRIKPRKVELNAIEFAKTSIELEEKCSKDDIGYTDKKETFFKGAPAYEYIANKNFGEGRVIEYLNSNELYCKGGEGSVLNGYPHKIIYFDYDGYVWRIIYPLNNRAAEIIIESFKFID